MKAPWDVTAPPGDEPDTGNDGKKRMKKASMDGVI
jgi:hypothetical protein